MLQTFHTAWISIAVIITWPYDGRCLNNLLLHLHLCFCNFSNKFYLCLVALIKKFDWHASRGVATVIAGLWTDIVYILLMMLIILVGEWTQPTRRIDFTTCWAVSSRLVWVIPVQIQSAITCVIFCRDRLSFLIIVKVLCRCLFLDVIVWWCWLCVIVFFLIILMLLWLKVLIVLLECRIRVDWCRICTHPGGSYYHWRILLFGNEVFLGVPGHHHSTCGCLGWIRACPCLRSCCSSSYRSICIGYVSAQ